MKMHRSDSRAFQVYILCCENFVFNAFICFHLFSVGGARVGHHGPLEHDILQETCCYHTTLAGFVYNPSAGQQQGTRLTKRRRSNPDPCSVECSALHGDPRQLSPRVSFLFPWRNHWVFSADSC